MKEELCRAFCDSLQIHTVPAGLAVSTPFLSPDGDRIGFYVRQASNGLYRIEDDGFTLPALEASGLDFSSGSRGQAMRQLLGEYGAVIDEDARVFAVNKVSQTSLPTVALRFVAFSLRVRDFAVMTEARAIGTFREEVKKLLSESVGGRAEIKERAPVADALRDFLADFVVHAPGFAPVGVFLGTGDNRVLEAIVVRMRALYEVRIPCSIVALLERGRSVTANVRRNAANRLSAVPEFRGDEIASIQQIVHEAFGRTTVH